MIYNFILINYNNSNISIKCVHSINRIKQLHNVLIVDNNSIEEQKQILRESNVKVLFLSSNIGYASALNVGIDYFFDKFQDDQIIIVGNNDLVYDENFCDNIEGSKFSADTMIICPNIIKSGSGVHQNPFSIDAYSRVQILKYDIFYSNYYFAIFFLLIYRLLFGLNSENDRKGFDKSQYIYMGHGACYILLPYFLKKCRRFDSPTFLFGEELFIGEQIHRNNGCLYYDKNIKVIHNEHSTTGNGISRSKFMYMKESYRKFRKFRKTQM